MARSSRKARSSATRRRKRWLHGFARARGAARAASALRAKSSHLGSAVRRGEVRGGRSEEDSTSAAISAAARPCSMRLVLCPPSAVKRKTPRAFPRIHGRHHDRAPLSPEGWDRTRSPTTIRSGLTGSALTKEDIAPLLRRFPRHRHRRCNDPRAAVHAAVQGRLRRRGDLERRARRAVEDRLNRALFLPFIALLQRAHGRRAARRAEGLPPGKLSTQPIWYLPADEDAEVALDDAWQRLTGTLSGETLQHPRHQGQRRWCAGGRAAAWRVSRSGNFRTAAGASDYLRMAHEFHTLILWTRPVMDYPQRNEAKHFIALIDTLYDNAVKLVASAAAEPTASLSRHRRLQGEQVLAPPPRA